jgi:hypothetical protein
MPVKVAVTSAAISWIPKRALVGMSGIDTPLSAGLLPWSVAYDACDFFAVFPALAHWANFCRAASAGLR